MMEFKLWASMEMETMDHVVGVLTVEADHIDTAIQLAERKGYEVIKVATPEELPK